MADFSLTTLFVVPVGQVTFLVLINAEFNCRQVGVFTNTYALATAGNNCCRSYFYIAQGRTNILLRF
jgi:hypothetical protein